MQEEIEYFFHKYVENYYFIDKLQNRLETPLMALLLQNIYIAELTQCDVYVSLRSMLMIVLK